MDTRAIIGGALTLVAGAVFVVAACNGGRATAGTDTLARGTWGGENAGAIVGDTIAHATPSTAVSTPRRAERPLFIGRPW